MEMFTFTIDAEQEDGSWQRVAEWQRFGMDEAEALAGTIRAARDEFPADALRVRVATLRDAIQRIEALRDELGPLDEDAWETMHSEDLFRHAAALDTFSLVLDILHDSASLPA